MFTACSDSDDFNTNGDVTVDMQEATVSVRESAGLFNVPIVVNGEANGPIVVHVETTPETSNPAYAYECVDGEVTGNYTVTSYDVVIPKGSTSANIQIMAIDNTEENDSRFFNVTIASVEGAVIGQNPTTEVELRDNDQDPYEKLTGFWTLKYNDRAGVEYEAQLQMAAPDLSDPDEAPYYGDELYAWGLGGRANVMIPFNKFRFDETTGTGTLNVAVGDWMSWGGWNFGVGETCILVCYYYSGGSVYSDADITCTFDYTYKTITFDCDPGTGIYTGVVGYSSGTFYGGFGMYLNPIMTRE